MTLFLLFALACGPDGSGAEVCDGVDNDGNGAVDDGFDMDGDGFLALAPCRGLDVPLDCDDGDATVNPSRVDDDCDGLDNNCSGEADEAADGDGDGYGCDADCDDADVDAHPGALESCDGKDNNCDGVADEAWDEDGDGVSPCGGDCNERDPLQSPNQPEICDGTDNDCDGTVDDGYDEDGDGFATCEGDCDDTVATVYPNAPELCDDLDNDCDGTIPDRTDRDADGYTICDGDCIEGDARAYPGATEACDSIDDDCNGLSDELPECYSCTVSGDLWMCRATKEWQEAQDICVGLGGGLAMVGDEATSQVIADESAATSKSYWVGVPDATTEGTWLYTDGTAVTWFGWAANNPSDRSGQEDCVWVTGSGWSDNRCTSRSGFVCSF